MLRIIPSTSAKNAVSYYSSADYYTAVGETVGQWHGSGAAMLGLFGEVTLPDWAKLCYSRKPDGTPLTARTKENRRVAYDFNFNAPKSVSLIYGLTGDERIRQAFREAVTSTMEDVEREIATRVRKNGQDDVRATGNLVWGEFIHTTSRPMDGYPDPSLHAHCVALNATYDAKEDAWKAAEFGGVKADGKYFEALFKSRLARGMEELGLHTVRTRTGWEIEGLSRSTLEAFSRRTALIERKAKAAGITDPAEKDKLGAMTREAKSDKISPSQLRIIWRHRLEVEGELEAADDIIDRIGRAPIAPRAGAAESAARLATSNAFERDSVVRERRLIADALRRGFGAATPQEVVAELKQVELIPIERDGERLVTTREVLAEENRMIRFAAEGRGMCPPLCKSIEFAPGAELSEEQRAAVAHVVSSPDRVIVVRGQAGTGKSSMAVEAVRQVEASGTKVCVVAPTGDASRNTLREKGFSEADTVTRLLVDKSMQEKAQGAVLFVDEAGLVGVPTMAKLFDLAKRLGSRVVVMGDVFQNGPVERGAALRLLETQAGLQTAELKEIHRQSDQYRDAVEQFAKGDAKKGLQMLDRLGWVHEIADESRNGAIAKAYVQCITEGKSGLVVAPTHREKDIVTAAIRQKMRKAGFLAGADRDVERLVPLHLTAAERADHLNREPGLVAVYSQNAHGRKRGEKVLLVTGKEDLPSPDRFNLFRRERLPLARGDLIRITRGGRTTAGDRVENGTTFVVHAVMTDGSIRLAGGSVLAKDFSFLDHGYATTGYASQGRTVKRVFVAQSSESAPAISSEQTYVAVSRGTESVRVFTDSKEQLMEHASRSQAKPTASESLRLARTSDISAEPTRTYERHEPERELRRA